MANQEVLAGEWDIDPTHTRIGFSARHAMVTKVRGAFNDVAGHVFVNPDDPTDARVEVRVQLASIDTRNQQRHEHLRSADFFDTVHYPVMVFTGDHIDEFDEQNYVVVGELWLCGITSTISYAIA